MRRILITAGGTGGHIYPAVSLAEELSTHGVEILFAGYGLTKNAFFKQAPFQREEIVSGTLSLRRPFRSAIAVFKLSRGILQALCLLRKFCPDVVVGFGSYHTMPVLVAAKLLGIPIVLHEQNAFPGRVNRFLAPFAERVALHFKEAEEHLSRECDWVGMPLRKSVKEVKSKVEAARYFGLEEGKPTLLIFGGSLGAKRLNRLAGEAVALTQNMFQVIHLTGSEEETHYFSRFYEDKKLPAAVKNFEEKMEMAWALADIAITRAGAVTIAELVEHEVPSIAIPFPKAQDNHQERNAKALFRKTAGGVTLPEEGLTALRLKEALECVFKHKDEMRRALKSYKAERPKESLTTLVMEVV